MWKRGSTSGFNFTLFSDKPISVYMQPQSRKTERSRLRICMNLPISMFQLWNPKGVFTLNVWWCNACQHVEMFPLTAAIACQQASTEARPLVEKFEHWVCLKTEQLPPPKKNANNHHGHQFSIIIKANNHHSQFSPKKRIANNHHFPYTLAISVAIVTFQIRGYHLGGYHLLMAWSNQDSAFMVKSWHTSHFIPCFSHNIYHHHKMVGKIHWKHPEPIFFQFFSHMFLVLFKRGVNNLTSPSDASFCLSPA